eukprot:SAG22_NODE_7312_length_752_cov_1.744257_1_plen_64_part_01
MNSMNRMNQYENPETYYIIRILRRSVLDLEIPGTKFGSRDKGGGAVSQGSQFQGSSHLWRIGIE